MYQDFLEVRSTIHKKTRRGSPLRLFLFLSFAILSAFSSPTHADHAPDGLAQTVDPNYVGCLFAVDDAEPIFRDALQGTCLQRIGDICSGQDGNAPTEQIIDCVHFEVSRSLEFLETAVSDLPSSVETEGLFAAMFPRRLAQLSENVAELATQARPQTLEEAIEQIVSVASTAQMLFWLARETDTPLEDQVARVSGLH